MRLRRPIGGRVGGVGDDAVRAARTPHTGKTATRHRHATSTLDGVVYARRATHTAHGGAHCNTYSGEQKESLSECLVANARRTTHTAHTGARCDAQSNKIGNVGI
jgi:hypothetical protein